MYTMIITGIFRRHLCNHVNVKRTTHTHVRMFHKLHSSKCTKYQVPKVHFSFFNNASCTLGTLYKMVELSSNSHVNVAKNPGKDLFKKKKEKKVTSLPANNNNNNKKKKSPVHLIPNLPCCCQYNDGIGITGI